MSRLISVECARCGKKLKVGAELAGRRTKCPGCGTAVPVPDPDAAEPDTDSYRYWFFQWGDWSDVKKTKAFFVLTAHALWTARLDGKAAKQAEEALRDGDSPDEALGDEAVRVSYTDFLEVRTNRHRTNLVVDLQAQEGTASEDFAFEDGETRDEVFAELRRRLAGWQYSRDRLTPVRAAVGPLISMGFCALVFAVSAGLAVWFKSWQTENNFIGMVRFVGPIGWAAIGAVVIVGLGAWLVARVRTPPDMLYLRPPDGRRPGVQRRPRDDDAQDE
jgi:hypothetical protein